ncbi:MAG: cell division protein FtsA, partial [Lachnospiraceae bacterium]|nr:cell division protein FtsA [Lachnospiraceae bacterium]
AEYYIEQILEYKSNITINVNGKKVICPKLAEVDGEIKTGDYRINNGDNIKILDYYTVDRLMTFMDIDCTGKQIYVNNMEVNGSEKIYENFSVNIIESVESDISEDEIEQETETNTEESIQEEVKPQDLKEEVLPIETKAESKDINVIVNGTLVTLKGKDSYIFVDILDFYPFDTKVAGGNDLITKINGEKSEFTGPLKEGDTVEIYWED